MRVRALVALSLLAALTRPAAAAVAVYGSVGAGYVLSSRWSETGDSESSLLDFNADLNVHSPLFPGLLDFDGNAHYLGARGYGDSPGRSDAWGYRLTLSAMRESDHPVQLSASRDYTEFSAGGSQTGTTVTTAYTAAADLHPMTAPGLTAVLRRVETENRSFGSPVGRFETTGLTLLAYQSVPDLWYRLQYDTSWNSGTFAESNYAGHDVVASAEMAVTPSVSLQMSGAYSLRGPTTASPLNPRYDGQSLAAGVAWTSSATSSAGFAYSYGNSVTTVVGETPRSVSSHSLSASHSRHLGEGWTVSGGASANASEIEAPGGRQHSTGESLSASANWTRAYGKLSLRFSGSASAGGVQSPGRAAQGAWGGGLSGGAGTSFGSWSASGSYAASYGSNLGGFGSSSFTQSLSFGAAGPSILRGFLTANLTLSSRRSDREILGTTGGRSINLHATSTWGVTHLTLQAALSDGLSQALKGSVAGDGLFLPLDYNTHSRSVSLQASTATRSALTVSGIARYLEIESPGQGTRWETALGVRLGYPLGAFTFHLEDTLSNTGGPNGSATGNVVFVRVTRGFGTAFGY